MNKEIEISDAAVDALLEKLRREAEASGYHLNPDLEFTRELVKSLLVNQVQALLPAPGQCDQATIFQQDCLHQPQVVLLIIHDKHAKAFKHCSRWSLLRSNRFRSIQNLPEWHAYPEG